MTYRYRTKTILYIYVLLRNTAAACRGRKGVAYEKNTCRDAVSGDAAGPYAGGNGERERTVRHGGRPPSGCTMTAT